ncbi:Clp1/GlmU family protein [Pyrococcus horikoshii]|nr:Clp1/GlmU family protein [Pyrococcus horikoshii]HII61461.1 polyhydroxyalkanoate depolymerase [Pyrococcus horikoshii]
MGTNKAFFTNEVPEDRYIAAEKISSLKKPATVMIIGDVDTGKTTLTIYLANELISRGFRVSIIDSDVGQKSILPPATISLAFVDTHFSSLEDLTPFAHYFVGTITPSQFFGEMVIGVMKLAELAKKFSDVVLIDTTGMIYGPGVELKRMKIEAIKPDLILALERENELTPIIKGFEDITLKLRVSDKVKEFSRSERKELRREKWKRYFENSRIVTFNVNDILVTGTSMFQGKPIEEGEKNLLERLFKWLILHGRKLGERYFVVKVDTSEGPRVVDKNVVRYFDFSKLSNLLLGLLDKEGFCQGVGILKAINFSEGRLEVLTPVKDISIITEIRFGRIRVREDGEELGLLDREVL